MATAIRWGLALAIAAGLSLHGRRKKSLDRGGALAAFAVGFVSFGASYRIGAQLLFFYGLSSRLTRVGTERKRVLEDDHRDGGQRTLIQVLSNSAIASICALLYVAWVGAADVAVGAHGEPVATAIFCGIVGHFACCAGDTWSSELGILARSQPRLVTAPWRTVPHGTNGGVTVAGLGASAAAGLVQGVAALALVPLCTQAPLASQVGLLPLAVCGAVGGSLIDSLLGATCQASWLDPERGVVLSSERLRSVAPSARPRRLKHVTGADLLTNDQVNLAAATASTLLAAWLGPLLL